jgi:rare lipoprotein A
MKSFPKPLLGPKHAASRLAASHILTLCLLVGPLAACSTGSAPSSVTKAPDDERSGLPEGGIYKVGNPYQVEGVWYYPAEDYKYVEEGVASWYGPDFHGKRTANGEKYDMNALTAAHPTLPLPSIVNVTNLDNGRQVKLRINDRGPFKSKRIIDISRQGAQLLGFEAQGTARVRVEIDPTESLTIKNQYLARAPGELPKIAAAPRPTVSTETLSPPVLTQPVAPKPVPPSAVARAPLPATSPSPAPQPAVPGKAKIDLPAGTGVYIQAGAFADPANAHRLEQQLKEFGNVFVVTVSVSGKQLYRVRLGPLQDDTGAEQLLDQVKSYGYPEAQIVRF